MALRDRLKTTDDIRLEAENEGILHKNKELFQGLKAKVHTELISRIDLSNLFKVDRQKAGEEIHRILEELLSQQKFRSIVRKKRS